MFKLRAGVKILPVVTPAHAPVAQMDRATVS